MDDFVKVLKFFMSLIGQWPYQSLTRRRCLSISNLFAGVTLHVPVFYKIYVTRDDVHAMLLSFPSAIPIFLLYGSWTLLTVNNPQILLLFNHIQDDFKLIETNKEEYKVLKKSAAEGAYAVTAIAIYFEVSLFAGILMQFISPFLDLIIPLNETRAIIHVAELDYYYFEQDEHFLFSSVHTLVTSAWCMQNLFVSDMLLYLVCQHACGLFRVLRYRLDNIITDGKENESSDLYKRTINCVIMHNNVLDFVDEINNVFNTYLLFTVGFMVLSMTFQGAMIVLKRDDHNLILFYGIFYVGLFARLICTSQAGQIILDQSDNSTNDAYASLWYLMPPEKKKIISFIMSRSLHKSEITIGKFAVLCMETFGVIQKSIFSYLSVLISLAE